MSLVKFTCNISGIMFPDNKILYNEVTLDSTSFPLVLWVVCKAFPNAESDADIFLSYNYFWVLGSTVSKNFLPFHTSWIFKGDLCFFNHRRNILGHNWSYILNSPEVKESSLSLLAASIFCILSQHIVLSRYKAVVFFFKVLYNFII